MTTSTTADGTTGGTDLAGRLTRMTNRTNLMVIDATLNALPVGIALPGGGLADAAGDFASAAADVRALARRMLQATGDLAETMEAGREPAV